MLGTLDRKEVFLCSLPICPAPDKRNFILLSVVLYQNSHISVGLPIHTSLLMLTLSNHLPRNDCNQEFRHFLVPYDFSTVLCGDLAWQSDCGFLKAHFPEVSATQEGNREMSKCWERSCNHLKSYLPVTQFYHLPATRAVLVTAGLWHLWAVLAPPHHTPQHRWGPHGLVNRAQRFRKICRTKLCPVCQVQNWWPLFLLCHCKAPPWCTATASVCTGEYVLTYSQPCSGWPLPNSRQSCALSNPKYA